MFAADQWADDGYALSQFPFTHRIYILNNKHSPISDPFRNRATPISVPTQRARMNGLLRPHRRVQRSLAEPIRGVKKRPRTGLRNHVRL